jgi:negative regulator of flagellin synthesis FlgM
VSVPGASIAKELADRKAAAEVAKAASTAPAAPTSDLQSKATVAAMKSEPPIDIEAVGRIKDAIRKGNYPIDLDRVADRLMESYLQLKG